MKQVHFKRIISFLITVAMILTMVPATFAAVSDFVDFPTGWSSEAMTFSVENDLLRGTGANRIEPTANLTRAEMATIINRAFGAKITKDISAYTDVKPTDWFYLEMAKAVNMQTFQGDDKGNLRPNDAITREEVMAVIARAMVLEQYDYSPLDCFVDHDAVSEWAKPYAAALVAGGYVNGCDAGYLNPKKNITREEFAQLMYNIFKTYHTEAGTYNTVTPKNCVMINQPGITLKDVVVYGDLVLGDGVGTGTVNITNVEIKGRLLARGGNITLTNVTTGGGVVVKNVNGETHFNNYKSEPVFAGVTEHTYTTYKTYSISTGGSGGGGGGSSGGSSTKKYDYTINYYYQDLEDRINGIITYELLETIPVTGVKKNTEVTIEPKPDKNGYTYVFNSEKSSIDSDSATVKITSDIAIHVYYDLQAVNVVAPDGDADTVVVKDEKTVRKVVSETGLGETETTIDDNTYGIRWYVVKDGETKGDNWVDTEEEWTAVIPDGYHVEYELYARVTLDYDDGVTPDKTVEILVDADGTYKLTADILTVDEREGYRFTGWFDGEDNKYTVTTVITASPLALVAKWEEVIVPPTTYDVYFRLEKGASDYYAYYEVEEGSKVAKPADPTKEGYNFVEWVVYDEAGNAAAYDFNLPVTSDLEIVAAWEEIVVPPTTYDVYFRLEKGASDYYAYYEVEEGSKVAKPADPTKEGYTFVEWVVYDEAGNATAYNFDAPVTSDLEIIATWDEVVTPPTTYDVYFRLEKGVSDYYAYYEVEEGSKVAKPADPAKEGYTFVEWVVYDEAGIATAYNFDAPVTSDLEIIATWDEVVTPPTTYDVYFRLEKGASDYYAYYEVEEGSKVAKPADPAKEGYVFVEWVVYDAAGNATAYNFDAPVTTDLEIIATWRLADTTVKYQIKFFVNAKDSILCEEVGTMTDITEGSTLADDVVDAFYTDNGYPLADLAITTDVYEEPVEAELWYLDGEEWVLFTSETPVVNNMEVYAMVKFSSLILNFADIGFDLPIDMLNLTVPYSTDRRLMHSFKDSMLYNRNKVANAMNQTDVQNKIYSQVASSTGLIDENGYFIVKHYAYNIPAVISTLDFQGEIREYVRELVNGTEDDIRELIALSDYDVLSGKTEQEIINEIAQLKAQDAANGNTDLITEYVDEVYYYVMQRDGYDEFIAAYDADKISYTVDESTILYMLGAVHGVQKRDFAAALELLGNDSISAAVSKLKAQFPGLYAELESSYNTANKKFCDDIIAIRQKIKADSTYSETYSLSIVMGLNTAKLVELLYNDVSTKLKDKLADAPYYYNDNASLKQFVESNLFEQIVYPYDASVADDVNTGYQLKAFMDYYDVMFNNLVLFDDAMTWYGTALNDEQYAQFKTDFADDLIIKLQAISDIMSGLDNGGTIRGYTIDDIINKVETLKSSAGSMGGFGSQIEDIINRICDILENTQQGRPIVKGYTIDDLADVCDKLVNAVEMMSNEEYDALNQKLEDAIGKAVAKLDEVIAELDKDGTILGRPIEDLVSKIDIINNFYNNHKDKIDKIIDLFADFDSDSADIKVDIQRWENALFGRDTDDRFNIDDLFEVLLPVIDQYKVENPDAVDGTIVIDEYTIGDDATGITANRYFQ